MAKGTLYLMIANGVFAISGYIIHFVLGRYLGPSEYGVFGIVLAMITNVTALLTSGFPQGAARYIAEDNSQTNGIVRSANRIQLVFCFVVTVIYVILAKFIADLLKDPALSSVIMFSALAVPAYALFSIYSSGYLNGLKKFGPQAVSSLISSVSKIIMVFVFVMLGFGIQGAILGYILAAFLGFLVSWRQLGMRAGSKGNFSWRKLTGFGIPATAFALCFLFLMSVDLLAVKALGRSAAEVGYYTAAGTIARIFYFIFISLAATILPAISRSTSINNIDLTRSYIRQSMRYMLMILIPAVFIINATSSDLVSLVYSFRYFEAAAPLNILVFGLALLSVFYVMASIIMGAGKPVVVFFIALPLVGVDVGLNILLIPSSGISGAAWATTITGTLGLVASMVYVFHRFRTLVDLKSLLKICSAALIVYYIADKLPFSPAWLLLEYTGLFLLYAGILCLLREPKREDLVMIGKIISLEKFNVGVKR